MTTGAYGVQVTEQGRLA